MTLRTLDLMSRSLRVLGPVLMALLAAYGGYLCAEGRYLLGGAEIAWTAFGFYKVNAVSWRAFREAHAETRKALDRAHDAELWRARFLDAVDRGEVVVNEVKRS